MELQSILMLINTPVIGGIFLWIVKVEKRLTTIETVCKLRNEKKECANEW